MTTRAGPPIGLQNSYDLDTAQHFLADHAEELIVAFDHHTVNPESTEGVALQQPNGR